MSLCQGDGTWPPGNGSPNSLSLHSLSPSKPLFWNSICIEFQLFHRVSDKEQRLTSQALRIKFAIINQLQKPSLRLLFIFAKR